MCWFALPDPVAEAKAAELVKQQPKKRKDASLGVDTIYHIHERYILDREVDMVYENSKHSYKLDTLKEIAIDERTGKSSELEEEFKFWKNLVDEDLYHTNSRITTETEIKEKIEKDKKTKKELQELRNTFITGFFMANAVWMVILLALQQVGSDLNIKLNGAFCGELIGWNLNSSWVEGDEESNRFICQPDGINPLSLVFLLFYAVLIIIQFFCLLFHRWEALIQWLARIDTEKKTRLFKFREIFKRTNSSNYYVPKPREPSPEPSPSRKQSPEKSYDTGPKTKDVHTSVGLENLAYRRSQVEESKM